MPQASPQYEELSEFATIAHRLSERFPEIFGGLEMDNIACVSVTNKDRPAKKGIWEVKAVTPPVNIFCTKEYIITVYSQDWEAMNDKHRRLLVADALCSISPDGNGKLIPFDMKDYNIMLRTFGVDYLENPDVPDILSDDVEWSEVANTD